ncbi:NAD(P)/FAD-dependent oxidoreductase [Streptomyces sp. NPDC093252]|uniref:NAD(P)/FAD-dependent oxidoreductase n=1 Tax=Streptomyces sp. NPDC093252 TaxID=3154980 RepID=UPI0034498891
MTETTTGTTAGATTGATAGTTTGTTTRTTTGTTAGTRPTPRTRSTPPAETGPYEVIVIGGGAAGLSAALVLGRARRRTLVVDAGEPRNAPSPHMQGFLTRDGTPPAEFLALGREEVARYEDVTQIRDRAVDVTRDTGTGTFAVTLESGRTVHARRLIVTTGLKDELPPVPGLAERFGEDVLHCPYCHGWEVRDRAFGVLATGPMSVHQALMVTQWSPDVTFFLHTVDESELSDQDLRRLAAAGVKVVPGEVAEILTADGRLSGVRLADGTTYGREVLFTAPRAVPRTGLLERLGARLDPTPFGAYPVVDPTGQTSVPGVYAAGNAMGFAEQVPHAVSGGYRAAAAVNGELLMTDLDGGLRGD